jgi:hypothetical protein
VFGLAGSIREQQRDVLSDPGTSFELMLKAILIPCSPLQSCQQIELPDEPNHLGRLAELVGGDPEEARYDLDAAVYVDENGLSVHRARNERATRYALAQSGAARQRGVDPGTPMSLLPYFLYGDVVLVGRGAEGELTDVPNRFLHPDYLGWSFAPTPFDYPLPPQISPAGPAARPVGRIRRSLTRFPTRSSRQHRAR